MMSVPSKYNANTAIRHLSSLMPRCKETYTLLWADVDGDSLDLGRPVFNLVLYSADPLSQEVLVLRVFVSG